MSYNIFLFLVVASLTYSVTTNKLPNCCCERFSKVQVSQLTNLLQQEAGSLRLGMQMMCPKLSGKWQLLSRPDSISFGAKDHSYGEVRVDTEGFVAAIKLVHVRGSVSCNSTGSSYWGCTAGTSLLGTFITTSSRGVLFPRDSHDSAWYSLPGFLSDSPVLVFQDFEKPEYVQVDQVLQVWYGEDLRNVSEADNSGVSVIRVFAWYL